MRADFQAKGMIWALIPDLLAGYNTNKLSVELKAGVSNKKSPSSLLM